MAHYECRHCGEVGCFSDCQDPEIMKRRAEEARQRDIDIAKQIIRNEEVRIDNLKNAKDTLVSYGAWEEKWDYLIPK